MIFRPTPLEFPPGVREEIASLEEKVRGSSHPYIYFDRLARLYAFRMGDWANAYRCWEGLSRAVPDQPGILVSLARAAFALQKKEEAFRLMEEAIERETDPERKKRYRMRVRGWTLPGEARGSGSGTR